MTDLTDVTTDATAETDAAAATKVRTAKGDAEYNSDDSSAQGRGLSSATTVYLQAPPQAVLPKPEHRPNCRCPVNNYRVVVGKISLLAGMGWDGH